jgi:hypothetical protein
MAPVKSFASKDFTSESAGRNRDPCVEIYVRVNGSNKGSIHVDVGRKGQTLSQAIRAGVKWIGRFFGNETR